VNIERNFREIFGNIDVDPYKETALRFLPGTIKVLFIAESPPFPPPFDPITKEYNDDWSYFYRYENHRSNFLRQKFSLAIYYRTFANPKDFLDLFCEDGYFLIDAVEYPINKIEINKNLIKLNRKGEVDTKEREKIIHFEAENCLNDRIEEWINKTKGTNLKDLKIIIIKVPVFDALMLTENPFKDYYDKSIYNVLNEDPIPFPMSPFDKVFISKIRKLLSL